MYNRKNLKKVAVVMVWLIVAALVVTTFATFPIFAAESESAAKTTAKTTTTTDTTTGTKSITEQLENMEAVLEFIEKYYADDVDINLLVDGAYQGIFEQLDPYSVYYSTSEEGEEFFSSASGQFYGIGIGMSQTGDGIEIRYFTENSAAEAAGMQIGDIIVSVDGKSYEGASSTAVSSALRGEEGTTVTVVVKRDGQQLTFNVKRALVEASSVGYTMVDDTTAYIKISNFYASTTTEFISAWETLENESSPQGLIIDLRNNPGGLVSSAITLSNLFLDKGDSIMSYVNKNKIIYTYKADGNRLIDVPVTLLVNCNTASASEIFAGALQDNGEAALVGSTTYGKGMAQTVADLGTGSAIKLSMYYFVTPNQNVIQGKGLTPSYIIYNGDNKEAITRYKEMKTVAAMDEGKKYKAGEKGLNVYAAQQRLKILGYENITLNGTLDEATQAALKQLQKDAGVYVYGALDFTTINLLEQAYQQNVFSIEDDVQLDKALEVTKQSRKK